MSTDFFLRYLDEDNDTGGIHSEVFNQLPYLLKECAKKLDNNKEKELFLVGAMGILSGMMPNVQGNYFGKPLHPNLYCFVIGKYGTGKGGLTWARTLGDELHRQRIKLAEERYKEHGRDMADYNRKQRQYDKGKLADPPTEPTPPPHLKLFIPANTTKTAVMQLLKENDGRGIIFETEGDTLADMLRQDYGNFSDILRKAYHHEPLSFFRRSGNEDVDIDHPQLSVVLSGTHDQLLRLIPSVENGLYSRFCFYILDGNDKFRDPFATEHEDKTPFFEYASEQYVKLYQRLSDRKEPLRIVLTPAQQTLFLKLFVDYKNGASQFISEELDGSINRLGVMCYRIAMIMTVLNAFERDQLQEPQLTCSDEDFFIARELTKSMLRYALDVYQYLQEHGGKGNSSITAEEGESIIRLHTQGIPLRKIAKQVLGSERKYNTVNRYIKRVLKNKGV